MATSTVNWKTFVDHISQLGYQGDPEKLFQVKQWLSTKGHNRDRFTTADGEDVDIEELWEQERLQQLVDAGLVPRKKSETVVRGHPHQVAMKAAGYLTTSDDGGGCSWHVIKGVKREDFDSLDNAGFGEPDEYKTARRSGGLENAAWVDYIKCITMAGKGHSKSQERLEAYNVKAIQREATDSEGGFLAPPLIRESLMSSVIDPASYLGRLTRISIDRRSIEMPKLVDRNRSSQEIAGFALSDYAEAGTIADDAFAFGLETMVLHKAAKLVRITNELMTDSVPNAGVEIRNKIADAVRYKMSEDVIRGSGVGQPLGIINSPGAYTITRSASVTIAYILDFGQMVERIEAGLLADSIFLAHNSITRQLMNFQITRATEGIALPSLWSPARGEAPPGTLWGLPFFYSEACSVLGTTGDFILFHPASYIFVESAGGPVIDSSPHIHFDTDEETLRVRHRRNGQLWRGQTLLDSRNFETAQVVLLSTL